MAVATVYREILPAPPAIDFTSSEGKQLFIEAFQGGTMEGFFKLISYFQTQSEPAYCGLASLAMVLNALAIDPGRKWKGPWRWFDESMLDCCEPLEQVKAKGIPFAKLVCQAHCAGAKVQAFRTNQSTLDDFRKYVMSCSSSDDCHIISLYERGHFKQIGKGHYSPIGGYHAGRDMVLILDVARFKYPPHWVPLPFLWEAMNTLDVAGNRRGFILISRLHRAPSLLYTLMKEFNAPGAFQSAPINGTGDSQEGPEIKWVSEDNSNQRSTRSEGEPSRDRDGDGDLPDVPKSRRHASPENIVVESLGKEGSTKTRQTRKSKESSKSSRQAAQESSGAPESPSSKKLPDIPKKSRRKKSKESMSGGSTRSLTRSNANNIMNIMAAH